jgi:hypothetical protein
MSVKLEKTIRREVEIDGEPFTVSIGPDGLRLTRKRARSGVALSWRAVLRLAPERDDAGSGGALPA